MNSKVNPLSLSTLSLQVFSNHLLNEWKQHSYNLKVFSNNLKSQIITKIPAFIYKQLFHHMIETHAQVIRNNPCENHPRMHLLIRSLIAENLPSLDLKCISHLDSVHRHSLYFILLKRLPNMTNLTEISFPSCKRDTIRSTICSDSMMRIIGSTCKNLRTLDISFNNVTDVGLHYLVPHDGRGCPILSKVDLFGCEVTVEGVADIIVGLPNLKFLGYRETGQCLKTIYRQNAGEAQVQLKLVHVNNVGSNTFRAVDFYEFECNSELINAISILCPRVKGLKIQVQDSGLRHLNIIDTLSILNLTYHTEQSPGNEFIQYITKNGSRLTRLYIDCNCFTTEHLKVVGEYCSNLKIFELKCNRFICEEIASNNKRKCSLLKLEILHFSIVGSERIEIPYSVINYILHKSNCLKEIVIDMYNRSFNDSYIVNMFSSINTSMIKKIMIKTPSKDRYFNSLSMVAVATIISNCPQLIQLGDLNAWDIKCHEYQSLSSSLKSSNSALNLLREWSETDPLDP